MSEQKVNNNSSAIVKTDRQEKLRRLKKDLRNYGQLYWLILPGIISVFIFHYIPIYGIQIAFKNFRGSLGIWGSEWIGFTHFKRFLEYPDFWLMMKNTLAIGLYGMLLFPLSFIFALMLNEVDNLKLKKTVQMVTYAPHFVSVVVVCSLITLFLDRSSGVINNLIASFGMERTSFLSMPSLFVPIFSWSGVWSNLGWGTIIYMAALAGISPSLIEAAKIDGASRFQIIRYINIPSVLPTFIILLILRTGSIISVGFEKIFLLQNPLNLEVSRVISTYVYEIGLLSGQFSYSTAIGLFNNVINITMIVLVNRISKKVTKIGMW